MGDQHAELKERVEPAKQRSTSVMRLQQAAQAKLTVGSADDPAEHNADEIADLVLRLSRGDAKLESAGGRVRRRSTSTVATGTTGTGGRVRRRDDLPTVRRPIIQRRAPIGRAGGDLDPETERELAGARSGGAALDAGLQRQFGEATGADVSGVRLHSGDQSRELNDQMGAEAFTIGNDVFFRDGIPDTGTDAGLGLVAHEVAHTVQQGASPISRKFADDLDESETEAKESEGEETAEGSSTGEESKADEEEGGETEGEEAKEIEAAPELSGSLPEIKEPATPEDVTGAGLLEEDATRVRRRRSARTGAAATSAGVGHTFAIESDCIASTSVSERAHHDVVDDDKLVGGAVTTTTNITGPVAKSAFGAMGTTITLSPPTWKLAKGKIAVDVQINGNFSWGTNSGGNTDVPSPTADFITAENYAEIAEDLMPKLEEKSWRPPRDKYWSQALTERHEKYHATDAENWVKKKGPGVLKSYLKKNPIELDDEQRKDDTVVGTKVKKVLDDALKEVIKGRVYYFRKGLGEDGYLRYPGEIRAFGDGKAPYTKLSKGITAHGKKLAKQKAAAAKATT